MISKFVKHEVLLDNKPCCRRSSYFTTSIDADSPPDGRARTSAGQAVLATTIPIAWRYQLLFLWQADCVSQIVQNESSLSPVDLPKSILICLPFFMFLHLNLIILSICLQLFLLFKLITYVIVLLLTLFFEFNASL